MALEQPKKPVGGAYGAFLAEKRPEFTKATAGQKASAISKMAGDAWKKLSESAKAPYQKKYELAKAKYEKEMKAFLAAGGVKSKGALALRTEKRKIKEGKFSKKKDPNRPKKPAGGAYGCFVAKNREAFQKECPGQPVSAVSKLAAQKWKALTEAEKKPYEAEYQKKKKAYEEAMKSYVPPAGAATGGDDEDEDDEEDEDEDEE